MPLSVVSLYRGIEGRYGPDVIRFKDPPSSACFARLVEKDGSPVAVGWFNDTILPLLNGRDAYSLNFIPEEASSVNHRIRVSQTDENTSAILIREVLGGEFPVIPSARRLEADDLSRLISRIALGALVLNTVQAREMNMMEQIVGLEGLRMHGLDLRARADSAYIIDQAFLDSCAAS